ncbi:phytanoyl-CoA dioxygenase family protein [Mucilaginibacter terrae]|uniref:Ectoine hydroxylase-related dioxygenase (Phytanoyl-CoA dioxygenase family) n=1 Tax=Mucilaginibacter terrae TaxID=1955052 RepID=A0ABU3H156_9SPHI|nr:phytanoyl-CoA dioxygenase family protein [Mucilaginibacter terrae]MDT3405655.1 ectoine hydroxylase-related dioxygenase (phytanoyl-CoA dioxygenase family) [Mucilaginibacter terrae]
MDKQLHLNNIADSGYTIIGNVFNRAEVAAIIAEIEKADTTNPTFRKTDDLFAIRQFLKELPSVMPLIFTTKFKQLVKELFGDDYFVVKSIYFDKPEKSNWFVAYHQDLTISVDKRTDTPGFGPWTVKHNQFAVQPPLSILGQNFTIRIHLDDTDETNGALKVIPGSHAKGIYRPETINWDEERETVCKVAAGGVMVMRSLLLHASNRSTGSSKRRVVHIEFSKEHLPDGLDWAEKE